MRARQDLSKRRTKALANGQCISGAELTARSLIKGPLGRSDAVVMLGADKHRQAQREAAARMKRLLRVCLCLECREELHCLCLYC